MSFTNTLPGVPNVESPLFDLIFHEPEVSSETIEVARNLRRDGFAGATRQAKGRGNPKLAFGE